jgi:hypothetical protein
MSPRSRFALPLTAALCAAVMALAAPAQAQESASAPTAASAEDSSSASVAVPATPAGPTADAAAVGVRNAAAATAPAQARRSGFGQPMALMVVGGAALLVGLIIGSDAGAAIAVGGALIGLYGLYQYLQ